MISDNQGKRPTGERTGKEGAMTSTGERKEASRTGPAQSDKAIAAKASRAGPAESEMAITEKTRRRGPAESDMAIAAKTSRAGPAQSGMATAGKGANRTGPEQSAMASAEKGNLSDKNVAEAESEVFQKNQNDIMRLNMFLVPTKTSLEERHWSETQECMRAIEERLSECVRAVKKKLRARRRSDTNNCWTCRVV
jgi:hypothetical protein